MTRRSYWMFLFALLLGVARQGTTTEQSDIDLHSTKPVFPDVDIEAGARLYELNCTMCHGPNGDSVGNVTLATGHYRHAVTARELQDVILNGIPGTGMPANRLTAAEVGVVIAYLQNMRTFERGAAAGGDAIRGKVLFDGKAECKGCHRVAGEGSDAAPDLTDIGRFRRPSQLQRSIREPSVGMAPINRPVKLILKDSSTVNGRRLNEDTYSIQIIDDKGHLMSFDKSALRSIIISMESPMPSYQGKLTQQEVSDIVAYLLTLTG